MFMDFIKFNFNNDHLTFYYHSQNEPAVSTMFRTRNNHGEIIRFLEDTPHMPFLIEKLNKYKYRVSFEKNYPNVEAVLQMLALLFPINDISMEIMLFNDYYFFGKCSQHVLDLYEMGYMSLVPVEVATHHFYKKHETHIYTGLFIIARNAFERYHFDYVKLNFFNSDRGQFLRVSLDMLLQDRPYMKNKINSIIKEILTTIPLKENEKMTTQRKLFQDWKRNHDLEIKMTDLQIALKEWKPSLFLKSISKLLDMFPSYHISPRFNLDIQVFSPSC
jgi:hypothetical protein